MNILLLIFALNTGVEVMRMYNPCYYTVKEVKIKKIECGKQCCTLGDNRRIK